MTFSVFIVCALVSPSIVAFIPFVGSAGVGHLEHARYFSDLSAARVSDFLKKLVCERGCAAEGNNQGCAGKCDAMVSQGYLLYGWQVDDNFKQQFKS